MGDIQYEVVASGEGSWNTTSLLAYWEETIEDWRVTLQLAAEDGHVVVSALEIRPASRHEEKKAGQSDSRREFPTGGLRSSFVKGLRIDSLVWEARKELAKQATQIPWERISQAAEWGDLSLVGSALLDAGFTDLRRIDKASTSERRPGRKGHPNSHYVKYLKAYVRACHRGSRQPVVDAAADVDDTVEYVRQQLQKCRNKGLLDPPPTGRPCGQLTDEGKALLEGAAKRAAEQDGESS